MRRFDGRGRWIWGLLLALSPLAGVAGAMIWVRLTAALETRFEIDRGEAIAIGRGLASSMGLPAAGMIAYAAPRADQNLHVYYRHLNSETGRRLRQALPEIVLEVVLIDRSGDEVVEVDLSVSGEVLGYRRQPGQKMAQVGILVFSGSESPRDKPAIASTQEQAAAMAEAAFQKRADSLEFLTFGPPETKTDREGGSVTRSFVRTGTSPQLPGLEVVSRVEVQGQEIATDEWTAKLDSDYVSEHLKSYSTAAVVKLIVLVLAALAAVVYAFVRYVGKTREKEISHRRNLAVGALVGLSFSVFGALIASDAIGVGVRTEPTHPIFLLGLAGVFVSYCLLGLLFGLFWGASEGEVRELFPGKLTSLDALVVGRVVSRNVARATLLGTAMGAWLLLLSALSQWPWLSSPQYGISLHNFSLTMYARLPWLLALLSPATATVIAASLGLMLPLALSFRHFRSPGLRWTLLAVLAFVGTTPVAIDIQPLPAGLALTAVAAVALLVSFYRFDLLTAMVALSLYQFVLLLVQIGVTTAFAREIVVLAAGIALVILTAQAVFAFRGRECGAADVQPVYALHQAQRRAMQAEVSAAREAQLRLSPEVIPQMDGVSLAAACEPARVVGGDFYDFFPISAHRLGIFFAEGGGSGLSAALSIAYAKGLLMPLARQDDAPAEVVLRLQAALGPLMRGSQAMGLLYAVVDAAGGTVRGARLGQYPRILVCGRGSGPRRPPEAGRPGCVEGTEILEWEVRLQPDDRVVLFTDGVARTLEAARKTPESWIAEFLTEHAGTRLETLQAALMRALKREVRQAKRVGEEDDLSTILLKFHHLAVVRKEEVA